MSSVSSSVAPASRRRGGGHRRQCRRRYRERFQKIMENYAAALRCGRRRDAGRALQRQGRVHARGDEGRGRPGRVARGLQGGVRHAEGRLAVHRAARPRSRATWPGCARVSKGTVKILKTGVEAKQGYNQLVVFRKEGGAWKIRAYLYGVQQRRARPDADLSAMSDERYTVMLGDRRYAIHRKWAQAAGRRELRLPVRPDGRRRGPRACGATRHRSAGTGVRSRRQADRQLGRGHAGRAALHQRRPRRLDPGGRSRRPSGAALRLGTASSCRRWASGTGPRSTRRSTIRRRRPRRPTARSTSPTATAIPASIASPPTAR